MLPGLLSNGGQRKARAPQSSVSVKVVKRRPSTEYEGMNQSRLPVVTGALAMQPCL